MVQNTDAAGADRPADQPRSTAPATTATVDLLPFEQQIVDVVNKFIADQRPDEAHRR